MKKSVAIVMIMMFGLSGVASALTYIDTPEGRRPVEAGEWFVTGQVQTQSQRHDELDEEWLRATTSIVSLEYFFTPSISFRGATRWASREGETLTQPYYSISLGSKLTKGLELQVAYDWTENAHTQQNAVSVGLYYEHLNH